MVVGSGTCPLKHRLTAHVGSLEVGGEMLVIYLVPSGSLCRALIPGWLFQGGVDGEEARSCCFQGLMGSCGQLCLLVPRVGIFSGAQTLGASGFLL